MKTKEYVEKYRLDKSDKFNHSEFVYDLTIDFMSLLEVGNACESFKGFNNAVNAIRMKFDAINNKTLGCIPEKLWNYFFATVIVKMKANLFPTEVKRQEEQKQEKKRMYEERKRMNDYYYNDFFDRAFFYSLLADMFKAKVPTEAFATLQLESTATLDEVKTKYRELSFIHHPDKGGKQDEFIKLTEAKNKCLAYLTNK